MPLDTNTEFSSKAPYQDLSENNQNVFSNFLRKADSLDWRYKIISTLIFCSSSIALVYIYRDFIVSLGRWGYLGAFLINGLCSATIVLPAPGGIIVAILAQNFNPLLIGILAGLGGTLGGSTAYLAGAINTTSAKNNRWFTTLDWLMNKFGGFIIFLTATIPILPGDLSSLMAGGVRYPIKKYLLYNSTGSIIKMTTISYLGSEALIRMESLFKEWAAKIISALFHFF